MTAGEAGINCSYRAADHINIIQMVLGKRKTNFFVSALACDEVNSDSIILMKSILEKCDRNNRKCKTDRRGRGDVENGGRLKYVCVMLIKRTKKSDTEKEGSHK